MASASPICSPEASCVRIHPALRVHLVGHLAGLRHVGKVTDDQLSPTVEEVADRVDTTGVAHVDDDLVAGPQELVCRRPA